MTIWIGITGSAWRTFEFKNGKRYHTLHGRPPDPLPGNPAEKPLREFLDRNNKKVFGA